MEFIVAESSILICLCIFIFKKDPQVVNNESEFTFRHPYWMTIFGYILLSISMSEILYVILLMILKRTSTNNLVLYILFTIILLLGLFIVMCTHHEKLQYNNKQFTYHNEFSKVKSLSIGDLRSITIEGNGLIYCVRFIDKSYKIIIKINTDMAFMKIPLFHEILRKENIKFIFNGEKI